MRLRDAPNNLKTYICNHLFACERPILYIDPFLPGGRGILMHCGDHVTVNKRDFKVVGLGHLLDRDESLGELDAFPQDHYATRESERSPWVFMNE